MKAIYSAVMVLGLIFSAQASDAKARPVPAPKPIKCPAGQKWDAKMKMCMSICPAGQKWDDSMKMCMKK
jgi:hypothetical protein